MKLVPLFRFWGEKGEEEAEAETDPLYALDDEMPQIPSDEQPSDFQEEGEGTNNDAEEEEKREEGPNAFGGSDDDMLKAFASVDDESIDNSALAAEIEDVPVSELLEELRAVATAFGRPVPAAEDDVV